MVLFWLLRSLEGQQVLNLLDNWKIYSFFFFSYCKDWVVFKADLLKFYLTYLMLSRLHLQDYGKESQAKDVIEEYFKSKK